MPRIIPKFRELCVSGRNSRHGSSADYLLRHELGAVLLEEVLVGHEREVVRDDAGRRSLVAVGWREVAQKVPPHSALPVVTLDRVEIDLEEHRHHPREPAALLGEEVASVDARPVERLHLPVRLEDLGRELEVALAEAVLDDVRAERPDDVGVALPEDARAPLRDVRPLDYADGDRVLHVISLPASP